MLIPDAHAERLIDLSDVLDRFERRHPRPATMLSHRYFGGLTNDEIAIATGVSLSTVERDLRFGRAWLARELSENDLETGIIDELREITQAGRDDSASQPTCIHCPAR